MTLRPIALALAIAPAGCATTSPVGPTTGYVTATSRKTLELALNNLAGALNKSEYSSARFPDRQSRRGPPPGTSNGELATHRRFSL